MFISLGLSAYGAARVLAQLRGGVGLLVVGTLIGVYVRPQELLLFLGAFAIAGVFRRRAPSGHCAAYAASWSWACRRRC